MSSISKQDYINSIEESASIISSEIGPEVIDSVFQRYGAHGAEDLDPADLPDVFSELYAIEADLR
ncbi:hypothetical protein EDD59_106123 [Muricomes intestini]|jgi:hypothetical protein|uniref:Uncharacterized protein n=1 Tax=Muricomes intestini TaxID=1796634 RepID=A0A4R3KB79_9FIRM|nr:hypothetical protein [Muricomes intestini]TCS80297.1 hypothetical protein EDD59_106123 [Muricomes intestini]